MICRDKELSDVYSPLSMSTLRLIIYRKLTGTERAARMEETRSAYRIWLGKPF